MYVHFLGNWSTESGIFWVSKDETTSWRPTRERSPLCRAPEVAILIDHSNECSLPQIYFLVTQLQFFVAQLAFLRTFHVYERHQGSGGLSQR